MPDGDFARTINSNASPLEVAFPVGGIGGAEGIWEGRAKTTTHSHIIAGTDT
jgi:hypothetical protein